MENIKKHLQENYDRFDKLYWETYNQWETKNKKLVLLDNEVSSLENEVEDYKKEMKYYENLLKELQENKPQ